MKVAKTKKHKEIANTLEDKHYSLDDSISLLKNLPKAKFDETIDIAFNLGVDPRHADQMVRGMFSPPNSLGKEIKIIVIASPDYAQEAKDAGADVVGGEELIETIQKDGVNFDVCIASTDMMPKIGKIAKILGPKGLMPNPKLGTATQQVGEAVKKAKSGQIEYRVEKAGIIHCGIAKLSFDANRINENIVSLTKEIIKAKPSGAKGTFIKKVYLSSTMGPAIPLEVSDLLSAA